MSAQLTFSYDREGDILYVNAVEPYAEQESDEIADGVVARMNPKTGSVENLEILFFSSLFDHLGDVLRLPVAAALTPPLAV